MKKFTTVLCSIAFLLSGVVTMLHGGDLSPGTQEVMAATTMNLLPNANLPIGFESNQFKKNEIVHDTICIHDTIRVTNTKYNKVSVPYYITKRDTAYIPVPLLFVATQRVREEQTQDTTTVMYNIRAVDSENVNHSTSELVHDANS